MSSSEAGSVFILGLENTDLSVRVYIMLSLSMYSFVIREGLSIFADLPAYLRLAILSDHCHATGLFPAVVSYFVIREGLSMLTDHPA